jgi:hypothetical protein
MISHPLMGLVFHWLGGIALCGLAGMTKERETPAEEKRAVIKE